MKLKAIEEIFGVTVLRVNTINMSPKLKEWVNMKAIDHFIKAMVTIAEGQN